MNTNNRMGVGRPSLLPHPDLIRMLREFCEAPDFRSSRPLKFVTIIQSLVRKHDFTLPKPTSPLVEKFEFSIFATSVPCSIVAPAAPLSQDPLAERQGTVEGTRGGP